MMSNVILIFFATAAVNAVEPPNGDYLISYHRRCCGFVQTNPEFPSQPTGHVISDWAAVFEGKSSLDDDCVNFYGGGGRVVKKRNDQWPSVEEAKDWTFQGMLSMHPGLYYTPTTCVSIQMMVPGSEPFTSEANFFTPDFLDELTRRRPTVKIEIGYPTFDRDLISIYETFETVSRVYDYEEVYEKDRTLASEKDVRALVSVDDPQRDRARRLEKEFKLRLAERARFFLFKHQLQGLLTWEEVLERRDDQTTALKRKSKSSKERVSSEETEDLDGAKSRKRKRGSSGKYRAKTNESPSLLKSVLRDCQRKKKKFKASNIQDDELHAESNSELRSRFLSTAMRDEFPDSSISAEDPQRITDYLLVNSFLPTTHADYFQVLEEANARSETHPMLSVCAQDVKASSSNLKFSGKLSIDAKPAAVAKYSHRSFRDVEQEVNEDVECFALALINVEDDSIPCANVKVDVMTAKLYRRGGKTITQIDPILREVEFSKIGRASSTDTITSVMKKLANEGEFGSTNTSQRRNKNGRSRTRRG